MLINWKSFIRKSFIDDVPSGKVSIIILKQVNNHVKVFSMCFCLFHSAQDQILT